MKNKRTYPFLILVFTLFISSINAQDLLDKLDNEFPDKPVYEIATFKTTRIALGHSIETRKKGALEISMYNRFWDTPTPTSQSFLADEVSIRYGLSYSISNNLTLGLGYTDFDKISDGYLKYKLFKQQKNVKKRPVSVTLIQGISHRKITDDNSTMYSTSSSKYAFTSQVLIARKFNSNLSFQISPTFIHRASNSIDKDINNHFAIGFSGRHKIGGHTSIVSEYYYVANPTKSTDTYNAFTVGINWEVSDLMLQFHVTNARNFAEDTFITQTRNNFNFKDPNFHFGFNATFILHTSKNKLK
ncbi:hypothetical protein H9W90_07520 [Polaribacter pectinis]|uniref:DUF5777 domain-containing protein n=1 Tax=Polaribacter pectinis TaxID=2738844 RepID=A0A7G9LEA1_9FLAO|nr:DUF5777 family beta-barrel protein [Polaribacter pectinis]QNM86950.1 hypothetical protein H9W90_07520 [Polaribacter pectinis]